MSTVDMERARREQIRWIVLDALNHGRPYAVAEPLVLSAIQGVPIQCTALDLRRELGYLEDRGLVELNKLEGAPWTAKLTRTGVDVVDYTAPVEPGIARPKKYW
jgi:hypothetical protein